MDTVLYSDALILITILNVWFVLLSFLNVVDQVFVYVFNTSLFPNFIADLIHFWYDDTYWSKILPSSILTPLVCVKIKVTVMSKFSC